MLSNKDLYEDQHDYFIKQSNVRSEIEYIKYISDICLEDHFNPRGDNPYGLSSEKLKEYCFKISMALNKLTEGEEPLSNTTSDSVDENYTGLREEDSVWPSM